MSREDALRKMAAMAADNDTGDGIAHPEAESAPFCDGDGAHSADLPSAADLGADPKVISACASLPHNDVANAARLLAHFGNNLCVMAQGEVAGGTWMHWDNRHWDIHNGLACATQQGKRIGDRILLELAHLDYSGVEQAALAAAATLADADTTASAKKARAAAKEAESALQGRKAARHRFAISTGNGGRIDQMMKMVAPDLRRPPEQFNADPWLVVTQSHTLRFTLADGVAACVATPGHARGDYATGMIPVDYDRDAQCPKFMAHLAMCMPDVQRQVTLQQYSGTGLLGILLQYLMYHQGKGANGKSVFLAVIAGVLGKSYCTGLPKESIMGQGDRSSGGASPDLVRLFGKRMLRIDEIKDGEEVQEDVVKKLTGGDEIPVRNLFKGYFDFRNVATPHMLGNGFPKITGKDNGIWRRILVMHWEVIIADEKQGVYHEVVADLLTEAPGILNWLIDGVIGWREKGLFVAPAVKEATKDYREEMDPVGRFVADCVEMVPGGKVPARALYEAYVSWAIAEPLTPFSESRFGKAISTRLKKVKLGNKFYLDCALHDVPQRSGDHRNDDPRDFGDGP